jgi:hypothetical protein
METDPRKLKYAKAELKKACDELVRLKSGRAHALEAVGKRLGWLIEQKWLSEADYYQALRSACSENGLDRIDSPRAIDACIRVGLEIGRLRPIPAELADFQDNPLPKIPKDPTGAARVARWKAAHREKYNEYQSAYMRWRYAKRRIARSGQS